MKSLRILIAVDSLFPGFGGAEKQALKLAVALRERGIYVEFVTPQIFDEQPLEEVIDGFKINRIAYPHIPKIGALILMLRFRQYLLDHASRFDALHVHVTHILAAAAGFARKKSQLPVITKVSGYFEFEGGVLDRKHRYKPVNFLIRQGLRNVDHIQTISVQTREKLLAAGFSQSQIAFIPNGIDISQTHAFSRSVETVRIGYCGRLREIKGVHVLLEAIASVKYSRPQLALTLSIAGNGEARESLQSLADKLGISEYIEWLGRIEDTSAFFKSLDIYVQPSFAEGLPNSVMEAMLDQRPVVASEVGGNTDLIEDGITGVLFPAGDASALSEQIIRLLENPELCESVSRAARQHIVERYGFDHVVAQLAELYIGRR